MSLLPHLAATSESKSADVRSLDISCLTVKQDRKQRGSLVGYNSRRKRKDHDRDCPAKWRHALLDWGVCVRDSAGNFLAR